MMDMRLELTGIGDTTGRNKCLVTSQDCNQEEGSLVGVGMGDRKDQKRGFSLGVASQGTACTKTLRLIEPALEVYRRGGCMAGGWRCQWDKFWAV